MGKVEKQVEVRLGKLLHGDGLCRKGAHDIAHNSRRLLGWCRHGAFLHKHAQVACVGINVMDKSKSREAEGGGKGIREKGRGKETRWQRQKQKQTRRVTPPNLEEALASA